MWANTDQPELTRSTRHNFIHSVPVKTGYGLSGLILRVVMGIFGSVRVFILNLSEPDQTDIIITLIFIISFFNLA